MRYFLLLVLAVLLHESCEKRYCECKDDMRVEWLNGIETQGVDFHLPNAVENTGWPFLMSIRGINQKISWTLDYVNVFQGGVIFIDTEVTDAFFRDIKTIEVPHEIFLPEVIGVVTGPVNFEFHVSFPEYKTKAIIKGTVFFYNFQHTLNEFNADECRWPCQIVQQMHWNQDC